MVLRENRVYQIIPVRRSQALPVRRHRNNPHRQERKAQCTIGQSAPIPETRRSSHIEPPNLKEIKLQINFSKQFNFIMTDIQIIKRLSIRTYLSHRSIQSTRENPRCGFDLSPLRSEHTPSFKVDYAQNFWYDHGTGEGGSIIDLVMRLERCDIMQTVQSLGSDERIPTLTVAPDSTTPTVPTLRLCSDSSLQHPALITTCKPESGSSNATFRHPKHPGRPA